MRRFDVGYVFSRAIRGLTESFLIFIFAEERAGHRDGKREYYGYVDHFG